MIEVDYFKRVNDKFGYEIADELLKAVAEQLTASLRFWSEGATAFRAHGDEFFMFGPLGARTRPEEIAAARANLKDAIALIKIHVAAKKCDMACTVSVGWTTSADSSAKGVRGVQDHLERAVARAKREGRNKVVRYDPSMTETSVVSSCAPGRSRAGASGAVVRRFVLGALSSEWLRTQPVVGRCSAAPVRASRDGLVPRSVNALRERRRRCCDRRHRDGS